MPLDRIEQAKFQVGGQASRELDEKFVKQIADQMWTDGIVFQSALELLFEADPSDSRTTDASKWNPTVADELKDLKYIVFAHQHQLAAMQNCMEKFRLFGAHQSRLDFKALDMVNAHVWVGLSNDDVRRLGNIHNDIEHNIRLRGLWTGVTQLRLTWQAHDSYFPGEKKYIVSFVNLSQA